MNRGKRTGKRDNLDFFCKKNEAEALFVENLFYICKCLLWNFCQAVSLNDGESGIF